MILFTILFAILLLLTVVAFILITIGGTAFIVIFGDIIVCIALVWFIIKKLIRKKK